MFSFAFIGRLLIAIISCGLLEADSQGFFRDKIYKSFDDVSYCFRRLNGSHTTGCTSKMNGNVGVVYFLNSQAGFDDFESLAPHGAPPYILVLPLHIFDGTTANFLRNLNRKKLINGAVFYRGESTIPNFSTADKIPNRYIGYYSQQNESDLHEWNPNGNNLQNEHFDFPIFFLENGRDLKQLENCFNEHNRNYHLSEHKLYPMCSIRLKSFMFARDNSRRCFGRSQTNDDIYSFDYCDSLESVNLFTVIDRDVAKPLLLANSKNLVILATRLDSTSFFSGSTPAATTVVSNLVTLLSTVHLIRTYFETNQNTNLKRNLMIAIFSGETYDFMGSQRFIYDLKSNRFLNTFDFEQIDLMIELNQLKNSKELFLHYANDLLAKNENVTEFQMNFEKNLQKDYNLTSMNDSVIPPSSIQSFLMENAMFPGLILSSFGAQFTNRFYNDELDTGRNSFNYTYKANVSSAAYQPHEIQSFIKEVSEKLATSLLDSLLVSNVTGTVPEADLHLIDELLFCYLENLNCTIHRLLNMTIVDQKPNFYMGVAHSRNPIPVLVKFTLAWLSGIRLTNVSTPEQCKKNNTVKDSEYFWLPEDLKGNRNVCFYAKIDANSSQSPAFLIENYDWNSRVYSTWTESTWDETKMEIFIQSSINADFIAITLGFFTLCASVIITYTLRLKSDVLFNNHS